ncbi:MAG: hypothetical protein ACPGTS_00285 [Minisyncoccia bacterium]
MKLITLIKEKISNMLGGIHGDLITHEKMKLSDKQIPDWIKRQATLGPNVEVDGEQTDDNSFWYLLAVCCPLIYESYAIVLHPFWINWKAKDLIESGSKLTEAQVKKEDFQRLTWANFFKVFNKKYEFNTANSTSIEIQENLRKSGWPIHIWYPEEGNCETPELKFILNKLIEKYGDSEVNYFYALLKTKKWENEIVYRGNLTDFESLKSKGDIRDSPTAIFPDDKSWCIVTDYDLPFTYVGGSREFIKRITNSSEFDLYELEPKFNEKK